MTDKASNPSTPSLAHERLAPHWAMIRATLAGAKAVKDAGQKYLPKFPAESDAEYERRKESAPWRPEFEDCIRAISSKPFTKEVVLAGEPSAEMQAIADDVDGRGNNLHVFARDMFEGGVSLGAHGILVDFPPMNPNATRAEEKAAGARPYWVSVDADEIIALRTERRGAREIVSHLRLREMATVINGFEETTVEKIRVIEPGKWEIWHKVKGTDNQEKWAVESYGTLTLDEVPFVFFATAERVGAQYVRPPLLDLATMQIELYRQGSTKEQAFTMLGAPMLSANGMAAPADGGVVETGPNRILYAPGAENITTSWDILSPPAGSLKELRDDCNATSEDMRRLGMQPMLPKTGNVTATASGVEAAKAHSAVGTWANALKDALEQAFLLTAQWMKTTEEVEVTVHTDFVVGIYGAEEVKVLVEMRDKGMISEETFFDEMSRRGIFGPTFDKAEEVKRLMNEVPSDDQTDLTDAMVPNPTTEQPDDQIAAE